MKELKQVLVVDHETALRRSAVRALRAQAGLTVADSAENGYEAITKAIRLLPDVVVMNVQAELHFSGVYACKEICANAPSVRVVLYDPSGDPGAVTKGFQMGAVNVLSGDYTDQELAQAAADAAQDRAGIHPSAAGRLRREFKRILDLQDNLVYVLNVVIRLTPAELNVLKLLYSGMTYREVTKILFISPSTMKTHISHILKKFGLESTAQVMDVLRSTELFSLLNLPEDAY